jgi:hypothetical protein
MYLWHIFKEFISNLRKNEISAETGKYKGRGRGVRQDARNKGEFEE